MGVLCHHTDLKWPFLTLTPDVVLTEVRLAIEVDPCGPAPSHRGSSHRGCEGKDRLRNELLAAVGWTVLRLRLDARKGDHIGDRDVVVESSGFTRAAQSALVEANDETVRHGADCGNDRPMGLFTHTEGRIHLVCFPGESVLEEALSRRLPPC